MQRLVARTMAARTIGAAVVLDSTIARLVSRTIAARTIGAAVVLDSTIARLVSRTRPLRAETLPEEPAIDCAINCLHTMRSSGLESERETDRDGWGECSVHARVTDIWI
jgi:hypothetical protein